MENPIIKIENLTFAYSETEEPVIKDLSLEIERGSFVAVLGHNGSGKSTLAKHLNAVLIPSGGKVLVNGMDTADEDRIIDIRRSVGMVFQNPDNQIVASVVEDDVAFAPENLGIEPSEIRKRVDAALETVGLTAFAGHDTHKLSGGQKQRVAIAGILAMNPECIIFDESTAMLDPQGRRDIMDTILSLREKGVTVVLITHYMNEAAMADKVVVVHEGKVAFSGTPKEVFGNKKMLSDCSLEPPQCAMLLEKLSDLLGCGNPCAINTQEAVSVIEKALKEHGIMPEKGDDNA
ncbi:MAG: energy-coupling factor transporter ATPase [Clostridia bacterium]|nr:energy-coupling factor transporter ATPase [Clostridia bacterium]